MPPFCQLAAGAFFATKDREKVGGAMDFFTLGIIAFFVFIAVLGLFLGKGDDSTKPGP
jgi:hypothetical protein